MCKEHQDLQLSVNLINFFIFFKTSPKVKKEEPQKNPLQIAGSSHEMGLSTEAKARYNKTNRHNSHVARVPATSSGKRAVRYIFGASILTNFSTVHLYVKKRPFTRAQTQFTCYHTYIKLVLFRSGCSFFSMFYFYYY